ncbi:MAG: phosphatidate cytidylyltransferase [Specibacter sp.]
MTGMIPIVVPKKPVAAGPASEAVKNDDGAQAGAGAADTVAGEPEGAVPAASQAAVQAAATETGVAPDAASAKPVSEKPEAPAPVAVKPDATAPVDMAKPEAAKPEATASEISANPVAANRAEAKSASTRLASTKRASTRKAAGKVDRRAAKEAATKVAAKVAVQVPSNGVGAAKDAAKEDLAVRPPVAAADVTGLPLVPVPQGPIATIPDSVSGGKPMRTPKAGRDLPAAISVGVVLLALVIGSLLFFPLAFVVVATAFVTVGVWEVTRAIGTRGIKAPLTPVMIGALAMPAAAYFAGAEGLLFALVACSGATLLWRSLDPEPGAVKSILAGIFSLMWIPFLLSFVFLMLREERAPTLGLTLELGNINPGVLQVVIMLLLVVANDTFGYLVGVLFGKHPMAPKISPKKSWEGFAGSLGGAILVAILATVFVLDEHWWVGFALAIGMVFAGTGGDFAESMIKRELGVKDMSNLLPGHGGVMDRLDSILFAAPVAYATFSLLGHI